MKRRVVSAVVLVVLVLAVGVGIDIAVQGPREPVYTVADAHVGLAQHARLWVGRTILVRGQLTIRGCTDRCLSGSAVLSDPTDVGQRLRVTWVAMNPVLMCLSSEKGTSLPTKKGATEIFLSTSRESSKSSKKREPGVSAVLIEKEATRAC